MISGRSFIDGCVDKGRCTVARRGIKAGAARVNFTIKLSVDKQLASFNLDMSFVNTFSNKTITLFQNNGLLLYLLFEKISFNQVRGTIRGSQMASATQDDINNFSTTKLY